MDELYALLEKVKPGADFKNSGNYVNDGLLDSLEIVELITAIEETYAITISGNDIDPDNFVSAPKIWDMIAKYRE